MSNFLNVLPQLKLSADAQIKVALDQLKESGQTRSFAYVNLAKTKLEGVWNFVDELLATAEHAELRALNAESKSQSLGSDVLTLELKNKELEAQALKLKEEVSLCRLKEKEQSSEISKANLELERTVRERNQEQGKVAMLEGKIKKMSSLQKELSDLKALNPHQLKTAFEQSSTKYNKEKKNHAATKLKLNTKIEDLEHEVSVLNKKLLLLSGQKKHKSFLGSDKKTYFHVREYQGSNQLRLEFDPSLSTINDLDWHIKIEAGNGICLHMGVSDYFTPLMPYSKEIDDLYPVQLNAYLHKFLLDKLEQSHPRHIKLIHDAKQEVLTTKHELFSEQEIKWLQKAKFITLYDACSLTFGTFGEKIKKAAGKSYDCQLMNDLYKKVQSLSFALKHKHDL